MSEQRLHIFDDVHIIGDKPVDQHYNLEVQHYEFDPMEFFVDNRISQNDFNNPTTFDFENFVIDVPKSNSESNETNPSQDDRIQSTNPYSEDKPEAKRRNPDSNNTSVNRMGEENEQSTQEILVDGGTQNEADSENVNSSIYQILILYGDDISDLEVLRKLYNYENQEILEEAKKMLKSGKSEEEVARYVVRKRNLLKEVIRIRGPLIVKLIAEIRNSIVYRNKTGPSYEYLVEKLLKKRIPRKDINRIIIQGVVETNKQVNRFSKTSKYVGKSISILGMILQATENSPESMEPLPVSFEKEVEIEKARLRFGIPADIAIDEHGHRKKSSYLQMDNFYDPHSYDEFILESEEILWYLGIDISYEVTNNGGRVKWTVPGRE